MRFKFGSAWIPKSQVDFDEPHVWIPEWLMRDKGLTPRDADPDLNPPFELDSRLIEAGKVKIPPKQTMKLAKVA